MLGRQRNVIAAGKAILDLGPKVVIVKKGEHGSFLFSRERFFALPAYPAERVVETKTLSLSKRFLRVVVALMGTDAAVTAHVFGHLVPRAGAGG